MSVLAVYDENGAFQERISDFPILSSRLKTIGIIFQRWNTERTLNEGASQEEILNAYRKSVNLLMAHYDFKSADVVSIVPDQPNRAELRRKFLDEHTHSDFEVRFFVDGRGLFFIHANARVYGVLCEQGDLISVPAHTRHWFDM